MKTIYPLKSKPKQKISPKSVAIISVFVFLSATIYIFPNASRRFTQTISLPFWSMGEYTSNSFGGIKSYFVSKKSLVATNTELENQISTLRLKELDYDVLQKENEDLKNQLGRKESVNRVLSKILSKPPRSPYDTFVLDAGSDNGVSLGNKVYLSGGVVIGMIKNVTPKTSLVELFSTASSKQEAVLSRTGSSFTLQGRGGANFTLEVPKDTDVVWGDIFMYPNLSSSVIGTVYYVDTNSQSAFKTVYIKIPGNVFTSQYVYIESN